MYSSKFVRLFHRQSFALYGKHLEGQTCKQANFFYELKEVQHIHSMHFLQTDFIKYDHHYYIAIGYQKSIKFQQPHMVMIKNRRYVQMKLRLVLS